MLPRLVTLVSILILVFNSPALARLIKIATYNVQNLFDLVRQGTEYQEYIPNNNFSWNRDTYEVKYRNIARVIADMSADIVALQEVESKRALDSLRNHVRATGLYYPYLDIAESRPTAVKCAILSKFPITWRKEIRVPIAGARNILAVKLQVDHKVLLIYVNHWKSKRAPESQRIACARALRKAVDRLPRPTDYILLGDFNSNYNECYTLVNHPELNDT
ncbi:MAG: endonuclease, partial [Deltaproteobacteria bacterium]